MRLCSSLSPIGYESLWLVSSRLILDVLMVVGLLWPLSVFFSFFCLLVSSFSVTASHTFFPSFSFFLLLPWCSSCQAWRIFSYLWSRLTLSFWHEMGGGAPSFQRNARLLSCARKKHEHEGETTYRKEPRGERNKTSRSWTFSTSSYFSSGFFPLHPFVLYPHAFSSVFAVLLASFAELWIFHFLHRSSTVCACASISLTHWIHNLPFPPFSFFFFFISFHLMIQPVRLTTTMMAHQQQTTMLRAPLFHRNIVRENRERNDVAQKNSLSPCNIETLCCNIKHKVSMKETKHCDVEHFCAFYRHSSLTLRPVSRILVMTLLGRLASLLCWMAQLTVIFT